MHRHACAFLASLAVLMLPGRVLAANVLFVSDSATDSGIPAVLMADGHAVTTVMADFAAGRNTRLAMPVDAFDVIVWSATGTGYGDLHTDAALFTNLSDFVSSGGRVFVTGYDSIASPTDPLLIAFVGGSSSYDVPGSPGSVIMADNSLTTGIADIRGIAVAGGSGDRDAMTGLLPGTTGVVPTAGSTSEWQWTLRTLGSGEIAYVSNGEGGSGSATSWSTVGSAYNGALRNFATAGDTGSGDPGSPVIEFVGGAAVDEGSELVVTVMIDDAEDDSFSYSWDLDDDGAFGEMADTPTYTIAAATTDGPAAIRLGVEATDDGGHTSQRYRTVRVANIAPTITSEPPGTTSVGAMLRYQLEIVEPAGDLDPLEYTMITGPSRMSVTPAGVVTWVPLEGDVTPEGETIAIEVAVSDGDDGTATQAWEMIVSPNHAPSAPLPLYPAGRIGLLDMDPRLIVQNAEDGDLDTLTYFFEIDLVDTFDSPSLQASGPLTEVPGATFWYPDMALVPGEYFWRAWVSDGMVESERPVTNFFVLGDPTIPPDGGPAGDGAIPLLVDAGMRTPDPGGCSCEAAGAGRDRPLVPLALFAGLVALAANRRRR